MLLLTDAFTCWGSDPLGLLSHLLLACVKINEEGEHQDGGGVDGDGVWW